MRNLGAEYLAERELAAIDELVARKQAAHPKLTFGEGWALLLSERPDLMQNYGRAAVAAHFGRIEEEIAGRQTANPKLSFGEGWRLLLSELPGLIASYNDAAELRPPRNRNGIVSMSDPIMAKGAGRKGVEHPLARVLVPIETQINLKQQANSNLTYAQAWAQVEKEHPEMIAAYCKAAGIPPGSTAQEELARTQALIDEQIRHIRQNNPKIREVEAFDQLKQERPDLFSRLETATARTSKYRDTRPVGEGALAPTVALRELARGLDAIQEHIATMCEANPKLSYGEAWLRVAGERPALIRDYNRAAARVGRR
jgi:hypothetical protein